MKNSITLFFILLALMQASTPSVGFSQELSKDNAIRVCILKDKPEFQLAIKGPYKIYTLYTHELLKEDSNLWNAKVQSAPSGILIRDDAYSFFGLRIEPQGDSSVYVNNHRFRGMLDIIREKDLTLKAINHVGIEEYLYGVLYHEISHRWPIEAIKSQAVAARSFALYQASANKGKDYDLTSDTFSQLYGGKAAERYKTTKAVDATKGLILTYKGSVIPAYFHATCGGFTEDASELWQTDMPPLKGVRCDFCKDSPHMHWRNKIRVDEFVDELKANGVGSPRLSAGQEGVDSIEITKRTSSGRVKEITIKDSDSEIKVSAKNLRSILGTKFLRSTNFSVQLDGRDIIFSGTGWGHGVGLCQWGAFFMSKKGYRAEDILKYYYPGAEIAIR